MHAWREKSIRSQNLTDSTVSRNNGVNAIKNACEILCGDVLHRCNDI